MTGTAFLAGRLLRIICQGWKGWAAGSLIGESEDEELETR